MHLLIIRSREFQTGLERSFFTILHSPKLGRLASQGLFTLGEISK